MSVSLDYITGKLKAAMAFKPLPEVVERSVLTEPAAASFQLQEAHRAQTRVIGEREKQLRELEKLIDLMPGNSGNKSFVSILRKIDPSIPEATRLTKDGCLRLKAIAIYQRAELGLRYTTYKGKKLSEAIAQFSVWRSGSAVSAETTAIFGKIPSTAMLTMPFMADKPLRDVLNSCNPSTAHVNSDVSFDLPADAVVPPPPPLSIPLPLHRSASSAAVSTIRNEDDVSPSLVVVGESVTALTASPSSVSASSPSPLPVGDPPVPVSPIGDDAHSPARSVVDSVREVLGSEVMPSSNDDHSDIEQTAAEKITASVSEIDAIFELPANRFFLTECYARLNRFRTVVGSMLGSDVAARGMAEWKKINSRVGQKLEAKGLTPISNSILLLQYLLENLQVARVANINIIDYQLQALGAWHQIQGAKPGEENAEAKEIFGKIQAAILQRAEQDLQRFVAELGKLQAGDLPPPGNSAAAGSSDDVDDDVGTVNNDASRLERMRQEAEPRYREIKQIVDNLSTVIDPALGDASAVLGRFQDMLQTAAGSIAKIREELAASSVLARVEADVQRLLEPDGSDKPSVLKLIEKSIVAFVRDSLPSDSNMKTMGDLLERWKAANSIYAQPEVRINAEAVISLALAELTAVRDSIADKPNFSIVEIKLQAMAAVARIEGALTAPDAAPDAAPGTRSLDNAKALSAEIDTAMLKRAEVLSDDANVTSDDIELMVSDISLMMPNHEARESVLEHLRARLSTLQAPPASPSVTRADSSVSSTSVPPASGSPIPVSPTTSGPRKATHLRAVEGGALYGLQPFKDELVKAAVMETPVAPPVTTASSAPDHRVALALGANSFIKYKGVVLTDKDVIQSTMTFTEVCDREQSPVTPPASSSPAASTTKREGIGVLSQDHTGKVVDKTKDILTPKESALLALKQAKMLLDNYHSNSGIITIKGGSAEQANRVYAALLFLKKDSDVCQKAKIESYVSGCKGPDYSTFTKDGVAEENFIKKHLLAPLDDCDMNTLNRLPQEIKQMDDFKKMEPAASSTPFSQLKDSLKFIKGVNDLNDLQEDDDLDIPTSSGP